MMKRRDRWMISYLDVLTILLILFIAAAARTVPPPEVAAAPASVRPSMLVDVQKKLQAEGLETRVEARGLIVSLPQAVLFASGDDRITDEALPMVARVAEIVSGIPNHVSLEGNADAVPIHNRRFKIIGSCRRREGFDCSKYSQGSSGFQNRGYRWRVMDRTGRAVQTIRPMEERTTGGWRLQF